MSATSDNVIVCDEVSPAVVLYQCSDLAMGCSSCLAQRIRTDFQCGWRGNTCVDVSATFSTNLITESGKCPEPTITISPDSGPTEGRTTLTINGTDLGTSFGDIVKITVGSLTCTPIEIVVPQREEHTLTINGIADLGTSFGDIVKITVGSLTCTAMLHQ